MNWISVKDKLPEIGVHVFITQHEYCKKENPRYYMVAILNSKGRWESVESGETYEPTHWALPEQPKEEQ